MVLKNGIRWIPWDRILKKPPTKQNSNFFDPIFFPVFRRDVSKRPKKRSKSSMHFTFLGVWRKQGKLIWTKNKPPSDLIRCIMNYWLVVSIHLKTTGQNGNLPQIRVNIKNIWVATTQISVKSQTVFNSKEGTEKLWQNFLFRRFFQHLQLYSCNFLATWKNISPTIRFPWKNAGDFPKLNHHLGAEKTRVRSLAIHFRSHYVQPQQLDIKVLEILEAGRAGESGWEGLGRFPPTTKLGCYSLEVSSSEFTNEHVPFVPKRKQQETSSNPWLFSGHKACSTGKWYL